MEFDERGNVTVKHYFSSDNTWMYTDNMSYDGLGRLIAENFNYADGTSVKAVTYSYNDSNQVISKQVTENGNTTVYQYVLSGKRVVSADIYVNGENTGTLLYEYSE